MGQMPPEEVAKSLLHAVGMAAQKAAGVDDSREAHELGQAALAFAQAAVLLDPSLGPQGVPLQHELAVEDKKGQTQVRIAKEKAAAPSPAKSLTKTGPDGKKTTYTAQG